MRSGGHQSDGSPREFLQLGVVGGEIGQAGRKKRDFKESGLFLAAAAAAAALLIRKQSREKDDASRCEVDPERASEGWRFHRSDIKRSVDSRFDMHLRIQKR